MAITAPSLTEADVQAIMTSYEGGLSNLYSADQLEATATITGISKANPGVITANHTFVDGDTPLLAGISGMTTLNGTSPTVTVIDSGSFSIGVDTSALSAWTSGGTATRARSNWDKKINAAWNMLQFDLRNVKHLDLTLISVKDSDGTTNDVQGDMNIITALLALSMIFGDALENVGAAMYESYSTKSAYYQTQYDNKLKALQIDYDVDKSGTITDGEENLTIVPGWLI